MIVNLLLLSNSANAVFWNVSRAPSLNSYKLLFTFFLTCSPCGELSLGRGGNWNFHMLPAVQCCFKYYVLFLPTLQVSNCLLLSMLSDLEWFLCRYRPQRYHDDDDDSDMEAGFDTIMEEEQRRSVSLMIAHFWVENRNLASILRLNLLWIGQCASLWPPRPPSKKGVCEIPWDIFACHMFVVGPTILLSPVL